MSFDIKAKRFAILAKLGERMAWKPRLPPAGTEVVPMERRKWVAVAESHAEQAVNLFVNIMKNQRLPYKMRMEAATRIVMIAGATFRGERKDGNGRPAANLPAGPTVTKLQHDALREALRQLPPGSVIESPEELERGAAAVVLVDSAHNRQPGMAQTTLGSTVIGQADPEEAHRLKQERLESIKANEPEKEPEEEEKEHDPVALVNKLFRYKAKKKLEVEVVEKRVGKKDALGVIGPQEAKPVFPRADDTGDGGRSGTSGQEPKLADSDGMEDSQADAGQVP